jgi:hypothetical protein
MMPIRFPTEAANDPDGKLQGMPESTGEDDIDALRGRARGLPDRRDRPDKEPRSDQPAPGKDSGDK